EDIKTAVVEGFAKLLLSDVCDNHKILSKLFVAFFDPATETNTRLRQCLSTFFRTFAACAAKHRVLSLARFLKTAAFCSTLPLNWCFASQGYVGTSFFAYTSPVLACLEEVPPEQRPGSRSR